MKHIILLLTILVIALGLGLTEVEAQTPDAVSSTRAGFYTDSLKSTASDISQNRSFRDSVAISFENAQNFGYYEVTAYSTSADTLFCDVLGYDGTTYSRRVLINLGEPVLLTSRVNKMITGTTALSWVVLGGVQVPKFLFTSVGANTIYFTVVGKRGVPYY